MGGWGISSHKRHNFIFALLNFWNCWRLFHCFLFVCWFDSPDRARSMQNKCVMRDKASTANSGFYIVKMYNENTRLLTMKKERRCTTSSGYTVHENGTWMLDARRTNAFQMSQWLVHRRFVPTPQFFPCTNQKKKPTPLRNDWTAGGLMVRAHPWCKTFDVHNCETFKKFRIIYFQENNSKDIREWRWWYYTKRRLAFCPTHSSHIEYKYTRTHTFTNT